MDRKESFWNGNALGLFVLDIIFGAGSSIIPNGSLLIFIINMIITLAGMILAKYWWIRMTNQVRYNSLVVFVMLISWGFFSITPLLRILYHTSLFIPVTLLYIVVIGTSLYRKQLIFEAFHKPGKSKIALATYAFLVILIIVGALSFRNGQELLILRLLDDQGGAFIVSIIMFGIGLLVSFISPAMLKKPEEITCN